MDIFLSILDFWNDHPAIGIVLPIIFIVVVVVINYRENSKYTLFVIAMFLCLFLVVAASTALGGIVLNIAHEIGLSITEETAENIALGVAFAIIAFAVYVYKRINK